MKRFRFSLGRFLIVSVFIAFLIGLAFRARDQTRLEIQIIPNYFLKNGSKNIRLADQQPEVHFHVLITNKSHQAIRLWEEWNEWGYFNLAFDVVDGNGKVISTISKKNNKFWYSNYPSWLEIGPSEHYVIDVNWDSKNWDLPFLRLDPIRDTFNLRLVARYANQPDPDAQKHSVWTGTIQSQVENVHLNYYRSSSKDFVSESSPHDPASNSAPSGLP